MFKLLVAVFGLSLLILLSPNVDGGIRYGVFVGFSIYWALVVFRQFKNYQLWRRYLVILFPFIIQQAYQKEHLIKYFI